MALRNLELHARNDGDDRYERTADATVNTCDAAAADAAVTATTTICAGALKLSTLHNSDAQHHNGQQIKLLPAFTNMSHHCALNT